jgi:hypothetical protein
MDNKIEDICKIPNHMKKAELKYLRNAIKNIKDKNGSVVNIGVYYGASVAALLLGMNDYNNTGPLFLVDVFKYHNAGSPKMETFRERGDIQWSDISMDEVKNYIDPFCSNQEVIYLKKFSDDVDLDDIGSISLIFIDGDHTTHGCLLDALKYSQKVISGGIMLFHDYTNFESVERAVKIFCNIREDFIFQGTYKSIAILKKEK